MPRTGLKQIYLACWQYLNFWGELPSEARGEAEALYKLRGNLPLQEPGYAYYDLPTEKGKDVTGPCRYDEKTERVVGCDFEYLNEPIIDDDCVLLATQWWVSKTERWFITERGDRGVWRVPGPGDRTRLVGRIYDRKTGALLPPKAPMKEEDAEHLPTTPSSP